MTGDLSLFKRAMIEATYEIYDEQCSSLPLPPVSRRHKRRLAAMGVPVSALPIKYRLIAALVAALLLLTGCTLFHEEIHGLWLRFCDSIVDVRGATDGTALPKTIETLYEPTYLPEGFAETNRILVGSSSCEIKYQPADYSVCLSYSQRTILSTTLLISTKDATVSTLTTESLEIMKVQNKWSNHYVWAKDGYLFSIQAPLSMNDDEILRLIDSLK